MLKNKQQAKKHAYMVASAHVRELAKQIRAQADREQQSGDMQAKQADSERRLASAMEEIADSLMHRCKQMKMPYVPSKHVPQQAA